MSLVCFQLLTTLVSSGKNVAMFCDFHGHSRRKNIFMFGCDNETGTPERVFPKMLATRNPNFSYKNCSFKVTKAKYNCARVRVMGVNVFLLSQLKVDVGFVTVQVAVWRDLGITTSYTIEASFAGADDGEHANTHFSPSHYEVIFPLPFNCAI